VEDRSLTVSAPDGSGSESAGPRPLSAAGWVIFGRQAERLIGVASIAILARLLTPADFGVVGMASAAAALVEVIGAFGFDWALVRIKTPSRAHYDTAWTLRLIVGLGTGVLMSMAAYPAADYYGVPAVAPVIIAMSANALIGAFENIGTTDFRREMRFGKEIGLRLAGKLCGFACAVAIAELYSSYWALVLGVTAGRLGTVAGSYVLSAYRPKWCLSARRDMLSFSIWLLVGNVMDVLRSKFAEILIGRSFGPRSVGFFSMASELSGLATTEFASPINRVMFTRYSSHQRDIGLLREGFQRTSGVIWAVGLPAAVGIGACAHEIINVLLGRQWADAALLLQVLAAAGAINIMASNTHYVYWALARSRFVAVLDVIATLVFVPTTIILGQSFGVTGVAAAQVVAATVVLIVNYWVLMRTLDMSAWTVLSRHWRIAAASVLMGVAVVGGGRWLNAAAVPALARLAAMVAVGAVSYFVLLGVLWLACLRPAGPEQECLELIRQSWRGRRAS
jgi:lipopolysaccharide exporter